MYKMGIMGPRIRKKRGDLQSEQGVKNCVPVRRKASKRIKRPASRQHAEVGLGIDNEEGELMLKMDTKPDVKVPSIHR